MSKPTLIAIAGLIGLISLWPSSPSFNLPHQIPEMKKQTDIVDTLIDARSSAIAEAALNSIAEQSAGTTPGIQRRATIQLPQQITVTDLHGEPVHAHITALENDLELEQHFFDSQSTGDTLWGNWVLFDYFTEGKAVELSEGWAPPNQQVILLVEAEGYLSEAKFLNLAEAQQGSINIKLFEANPITVNINMADGDALANVKVTRYGMRDNGTSGNGSFEKQVRAKLFSNEGVTDANGQIVFANVEKFNHLTVEGNGEYSAAQKYKVRPGETVNFELTNTFTVSGHVFDVDGQPLANIGVGAYLGYGAPDRNIQSVATDASGYYEMISLTATSSNVEVLTYSPGMVSQIHALSFPKMGEKYEVDFKVPVGVGGRFRFVTSWGEPLVGAVVGFLKKEHDWAAYSYQVEEDGWVECQKAFDPSISYYVNYLINDLQIRSGTQITPGAEQEIVVKSIAKISEIKWRNQPAGEDPTAFVFYSRNSNTKYDSRWRSKYPMPFLPAGAGTLDVIWPNKVKQSFDVMLREGPENVLELDYATAQLSFTIPKGITASAQLISVSGLPIVTKKDIRDVVSIDCTPGVYTLKIKTNESYTTLHDVHVSDAGLSMGELQLEHSASVFGVLLNDDGMPWQGADIIASTLEGKFLGEPAKTSNSGAFLISRLPGGNMRLMVLPEVSLGRVGSSIIKNLSILPGENLGPITLQMSDNEYLRAKFSPLGLPQARGFCLGNNKVSYNDVSSEGFFLVSRPQRNTWLGAGAATCGKAWWFAKQVSAGETSATVDRVSEVKNYTFLDEQNNPCVGMTVKFELDKTFLPGTSTTDASGNIRIEHSPGINLEMIAMLPGGSAQRWAVLSTPSGNVVASVNGDEFLWNIRSSDGSNLVGAIIAQHGGYGSLRSDAFGTVSLPSALTGVEFTVSAAGHIPLKALPENEGTLILPKTSTIERLIYNNKEAQYLSYEPVSGVNFARDIRQTLLKDREGDWAIGNVPEGVGLIKAYAADSTVIWSTEVYFPQEGQESLKIE